jgi:UDP:flavonoid glycosyltransferase YjiC (YdhE family)
MRIALLHTMLPATLLPGFPPIDSLALPHDKEGIERAHHAARRRIKRKRWHQKLMFLGCDDNLIIERRIRRNTIPPAYLPQFPSVFNYTIRGVPQLILAPKAFDFEMDRRVFPCNYLGAWVSHGRKEDAHADFRHLQHTVFDRLEAKHLTLIYCSFGTIPERNRNRVLTLLHKLIEATRNQHYLLLVSLKLEGSRLKESPDHADHVYIFDYLPQLEILKKARLFITHGGLNSIKESIACGVPMLVYPLEHKVDQRGNASRVLYHRLGLRGDIEADAIPEIRLKISALLTDPSYSRHILQMHQDTREEDPAAVFTYIDHIPPLV